MDRNRFAAGLKSDISFTEKERRRIIRKSVDREPWRTKCTIAMEEFAELQQRVSKQIRGYDDRIGLLEEMADVYISLELLKSWQISISPVRITSWTSGGTSANGLKSFRIRS